MPPGENSKSFIVHKHYEVTDIVLGRGGFSTVHLAYHLVCHNKVALKIINRNDIKEEYVTRNLQREAKILMKLHHPNIVNFYEEFSQNELYCLSLEYIKGVTLSQYLKKQDSFRVSEKVAKMLFFQMISAVQHMHQNKILHRDLKQENILVEHGKVIKIVDFGLSNIFHNKAQLRTHCGSLVYAAPELFQNRSVYGTGVDLWSLGVILYTMVIGKLPFVIAKNEGTSSSNFRRKELFLKRISLGLTRQNLEDMRMLSFDCCNLLKNLLQPDQFKRMPVKSAMVHSWFHKDQDLRRNLPQPRPDLREKFTVDIIDYMAEKLGVSRQRVQIHLQNYRFDTISTIFSILQDTLMKEAMYPPRILVGTFLFKFETWKRDFYVKKRNEREKRAKSRLKSESSATFPRIREDYKHISNLERPVFSYNVGEISENFKNKLDINGLREKKSIDNPHLNPSNSRSKSTKSMLKESGYNTGLLESYHEVDKVYPNKKKHSNKSEKNAATEYVVDGKSVKNHKDSGIEGSGHNFNSPLKSFESDKPCQKFTIDLIDGRSIDRSKYGDLEKSCKSTKIPFKSYKNSRPSKNTTLVINEKCIGDHKNNDVPKCDKSSMNSSFVTEENANFNGKLKHFDKKSADPQSTNQFSDENNTYVTGNSPKAPNLYEMSSAIGDCKIQEVSHFAQSATRTFSAKKFGYRTNYVKQYDDTPRVGSQSSLSVRSKTYVQRNIIINKADRGSERTFFNSSIPVRSFRSSLATKAEEKLRNQEVIRKKQRMFSTSYSSSISRDNK